MRAIIIDEKRNEYEIMSIMSFELRRTDGSSCDGFEITFPCDSTKILDSAMGFRFEHEGKIVFTGMIDECDVSYDKGMIVTVSGRGMGAVLSDSEAQSCEINNATVDDIMSKFVTPLGVSCTYMKAMPKVSLFKVSSGNSIFSVVSDFAAQSDGSNVYFSNDGTLVISKDIGNIVEINDDCRAFDVEYRNKRYGLISKVTVKNTRGKTVTVRDDLLINKGINASRVVMTTLDRTTGDMEKIGRRIIEKSKSECSTLFLTLPMLFAAEPLDICAVNMKKLNISGNFKVFESVTWAEGKSFGTRLYMREVM